MGKILGHNRTSGKELEHSIIGKIKSIMCIGLPGPPLFKIAGSAPASWLESSHHHSILKRICGSLIEGRLQQLPTGWKYIVY